MHVLNFYKNTFTVIISISARTLHFTCLWIWYVKLIFSLLFDLFSFLYHLFFFFFFFSTFWYLAASALCRKGNAWELNFSYQVREQSLIFWVSMAWMRFIDSLADYLLLFLTSRYTMFWVLLIVSKLAFSYYVEVFHSSFLRTYYCYCCYHVLQ